MLVHHFTWPDLPLLVELINLVREAEEDELRVSLSSLKEELSRPGLTPEENCFLFKDGENLRAYSILHPELRIGRAVLELSVHPSYRDAAITKEVVRHSRRRAGELSAQVLHICVPPSQFWKELLEAEGFSLVRNYWQMRWQGDKVPSVELPKGFIIESFRPGDEGRLTRVQNASFDGSWGFCSNTVEEVAYRAGMSMHTPEGILFLTHGDHTPGYCWTCVLGDASHSIGVIGMVGIDPAYRSRGLGKPLLLAGMKYLHTRGVKHIRLNVDGENSPAVRLYASVGFRKAMRLHWFEARLSVP